MGAENPPVIEGTLDVRIAGAARMRSPSAHFAASYSCA
jgi:hypothetical protein